MLMTTSGNRGFARFNLIVRKDYYDIAGMNKTLPKSECMSVDARFHIEKSILNEDCFTVKIETAVKK